MRWRRRGWSLKWRREMGTGFEGRVQGGIGPQEKLKLERDPMKTFMEGGIEDLAKMSLEEIESSKHIKDDIDVRLKWLCLFRRRKHHCQLLSFGLHLNQGESESGKAPWQGVRERCKKKWKMFQSRLANVEDAYYKAIRVNMFNSTTP